MNIPILLFAKLCLVKPNLNTIEIRQTGVTGKYSKNFSGINRKIKGKTRIIKRFIWIKKLNRWKFLEFAYISQECVEKTGFTDITSTDPEFSLEWIDRAWIDRQTLFLNCQVCNNELIASGSYLSSDSNGDNVKYKCTDCGRVSTWNFNIIRSY